MTEWDRILSRKEGRVGHLVFNNPARHNAMSLEMWDGVDRAMAEFAADAEIRVVILSGAGDRAFVSGADISRFQQERGDAAQIARYNEAVARATESLAGFPKPTIAMIRGYCIGGGVALAISCDLRICTETARFAIPAGKLGLGYAYPGVKRLVDLIGPAYAMEVFFTARQFSAAEAQAMGLVNRVVPETDLEAYVDGYATAIAGNAPLTLQAAKFVVGEVSKDESRRDRARCDELIGRCFTSADYEEGRRAFMEKRKPVFTGS